jgi:hypothetical protein
MARNPHRLAILTGDSTKNHTLDNHPILLEPNNIIWKQLFVKLAKRCNS